MSLLLRITMLLGSKLQMPKIEAIKNARKRQVLLFGN